MRRLLSIIGLLVAFAASGLAAEPAKQESSPIRDEALRFILDKAKLYTEKAEDAIGKAVDIAQVEVPETIRQFLVWRAWKHGICAASALGIPFLVLCGALLSLRKGLKMDSYENFPYIMGAIIPGVMLLMTGPVWGPIGLSNLLSFVQIQVAPRIYLIEEASKLLR